MKSAMMDARLRRLEQSLPSVPAVTVVFIPPGANLVDRIRGLGLDPDDRRTTYVPMDDADMRA